MKLPVGPGLLSALSLQGRERQHTVMLYSLLSVEWSGAILLRETDAAEAGNLRL